MRTAIWTDVKEMNYNLTITSHNAEKGNEVANYQVKARRRSHQPMNLDQTDSEIADKLSENGRVSMETLGKKIGISSDTAKRRYEKLKKNGVLKVTIQVNPSKIGYQALCIFFTVTSHENSFGIIEKIAMIPDVISIMKTTGDYDLQIYAMVKDIGQFLSIQEQLGKVQGITKMDAEISSLERWEKWPSPRQHISTF
jgi:DNA-binding Lrp family transcriptional regulator